jgi:hypothetical protein
MPIMVPETEAPMTTQIFEASPQLTEARSITANPQPHHTDTQRLFAWLILKAERGQIVRQHRLQAKTAVPNWRVVR